MDCVRASVYEHTSEKYSGDYTVIPKISSVGGCRDECVSDLKCKAWYYDAVEKECNTTHTLKHPHPKLISASRHTHSGIIECEDDWSMLKLMLMIFVLGSILVGVWFGMRCKDRRVHNI